MPRRKKLKKPFKQPQRKIAVSSKLEFHQLDWLEWLSLALCIWFLFFPYPYKLLFSIILCLPIIGLVLNGLSRPSLASLVSISDDDKYDLADFIEFPGLVLVIRVLLDFEFESIFSILKVGTVTFLLLLLLVGLTHRSVAKSNKNKWIIYGTVIGNIALYTYAATYGVNCVFDNSEPEVYQAKVIDKSISRSKGRSTYYLKVEPWGHHYDAERISVSGSQYANTEIGETVDIDYKQGRLGIPWYYVSR